MKVIEQLVAHLRSTGSLSDVDVAQLRDQGFLPALSGEDHDEYDDYDESWHDRLREEEFLERELAEENRLHRRLTVRDRQRRTAANKSRKRKTSHGLRQQVAESVKTWAEGFGGDLLWESFGISGHWRTVCNQICTVSETELQAILLRHHLSEIQEWLLCDPVWAVMDAKPLAGLDKSAKSDCDRNAARLLSPWHRAQTRVCRSLAVMAFASPGLFDMIGWLYDSRPALGVDSTFVWLVIAGKLLKCRTTSPAALSTMTLPPNSLLTLQRNFWLFDETLSREELWMLSLVVKSLHLSKDLANELVGYPEIRFRWEEIPVEIHGRLRRFLSHFAWWMS